MKTKLIIETPMTDLDDAINRWIQDASSKEVHCGMNEEIPDGKVKYDNPSGSEVCPKFYYELTEVIQIIYQQSIIQAYELNGNTQKPQTLRSALIFYK